jgi:hypothetical protein
MNTNPPGRSVIIGADERGGWSSDRPRDDKRPPRPVDVSVRCRILHPSDRMRYSPGSLLVIVSAAAEARERFAERLITNKSSLLSTGKVRALIAGRVPDEEIDARAAQLLDAAVAKRLEAGETVVIVAESLDPAERERFVRPAHAVRRPRHIMLLDVGRDQVSDEDRPAINELRTQLDAGALGAEGFQTAIRLTDTTMSELKRIVFAPPPADD